MLGLNSLVEITPKMPAAAPICEKAKDLQKSLNGTEETLQNYVIQATQLEQIRKGMAANLSYEDEVLPVADIERELVIGMAMSAQGTYKVMYGIQKYIQEAEPFVNIPQLDRIKTEYSVHGAKMPCFTAGLVSRTIATLGGQQSAGTNQNSPVPSAP